MFLLHKRVVPKVNVSSNTNSLQSCILPLPTTTCLFFWKSYYLRYSWLLWVIFNLNITFLYGQKALTGSVNEKLKNGSQVSFAPLVGASVFWSGTDQGTTTNEKGQFKLNRIEGNLHLIVSYVGYKSDTMRIADGQKSINIVMEALNVLNEVEVTGRQKGEYVDKMNPIKTEVISTSGLQRLACCNLSESFENSGTVDVNYSDAVTGAKQIQMLGLAGIYTQMLGENMPLLQGLSYSYGLTYVPGTWMQSIQVSKGTSSVVNGFESITGQINAEFKKPTVPEPLFVNAYMNSEGKGELNVDFTSKISERFSAMTLLHTESQLFKQDDNHDGFLDVPLSKQLNVFQRFNYEVDGKLKFQYGIKALVENKIGGQNNFNPSNDKNTQNAYGIGIDNQRYELITKHGFVLQRHATSIGLQVSGSYQKQDTYFGLNTYDASEKNLYSNLIYHSYLFSENNTIDVGSSFVYSGLQEDFKVSNLDTSWKNENQTTGLFAQYTYDYQKVLNFIIGFRADYYNRFGMIYTPRFHVKYDFTENINLRFSIGKGTHISYPVAENISSMVSSRKWYFTPYDKPDEAWNGGFSLEYKIKLKDDKNIQINADAYRTVFTDQLIIDNVSNPREIRVYPLQGKSFSNSYQLNVTTGIIKNLDLTLIGRYNQVEQTYQNKLMIKPMVTPFKALFTASYSTRYDKWIFDLTTQWNSQTTLPDLSSNPVSYQLANNAPAYTIIHFQVTRKFKHWDIYAGVENLLNFTQKITIMANSDPFGPYFDASLVWGPIMGRLYYTGIRYKLTKS